MFPISSEKKLQSTLQFYTNLKIKKMKKNKNINQLEMFNFTDEEKAKQLEELVKVALSINKEVITNMSKYINLDKAKEKINKEWVKSLFKIVNSDVDFEKLQRIRLDRVNEQLKKWNINIVENGKLSKTQLKALKTDVELYRNNKQIREIIDNFERGNFSREDIKELDAYLKRRNENIARNETGNLYAEEFKDTMIENDLEFYIWRTMEDERVREEHAEKEGEKFSIHDSPRPGEEFNCRCWAEPIKNKN